MNIDLRNTKLIYRDLIKLVKIVMNGHKKIVVMSMIRKEFEKNKNIKDQEEILKLKRNAGKSIADLYIHYVKESYKESSENSDKGPRTGYEKLI
jgi:hypothetical protein